MKKKLLIFTLILVLTLGTIISVYAASPGLDVQADEDEAVVFNENYISEEEAINIAVTGNDGATFESFNSIELGDENGTIIYEVEFLLAGVELEVKVDATHSTLLPADDDHEDLDDVDDSEDDLDDDQIEHEFDGEEEHED